jgi:hypothetical protein
MVRFSTQSVALRLSLAAFAAGAWFAPVPLQAQVPGPSEVLRLPKTTRAPVVDGRIDEWVWRHAARVTSIHLDGAGTPTEPTEVRALVDVSGLYIAFICFDSQPDAIMAREQRSDRSMEGDDRVWLIIDVDRDGRSEWFFAVNARGTSSGTRTVDSRVQRIDSPWASSAARTTNGWTAEVAVPFALWDQAPPEGTIAIDFARYHARTLQTSRWSASDPRGQDLQVGRLAGLPRGNPGPVGSIRPRTPPGGLQVARTESTPMAGAPEPSPQPAALSQVTLGSEVVAVSEYIWRGVRMTGSSVQPTTWVRIGDLTAYSWFNAVNRGPDRVTEHDLTVEYSRTLRGTTIAAGWINYWFSAPVYGANTNEIFAGVSLSGPLNPSIKLFQDLQAGSGTYVNTAVSHSFPVARRMIVTPSASLGYNHRQFISESTFSDANLGVRLSLLGGIDKVALVPFMNYSRALNRRLFDDHFYGGVGLAVGGFDVPFGRSLRE